MTTNALRRAALPTAAAVAALLALTACSARVETSSAPATTQAASADTATPEPADETSESAPETEAAAGDIPTVPGYAPGEAPAVPLFELPDLGLLTAANEGFTVKMKELVGTYPGLRIAPARCDAAGKVAADQGSILLYGDGSGIYSGADGSVINYGDGAGEFTIDGVNVINYGDGAGSYSGNGVSIINYGDGAGVYSDADKSVTIYGDGAGLYSDGDISINNHGDGSAVYTNGDITIDNYGDGSGTYVDSTITINNYGDGTATVNGESIKAEPWEKVPPLGKFPPIDALQPITSCGTTITLESGVLFDVDQYSVRPEAATVLDTLAKALADTGAPKVEIAGHTDSVRDDAWNQTLSENRAAAVADALRERGVTSQLDSVGYGETHPIAPNDTAAGRQENRRVEIFVPAF